MGSSDSKDCIGEKSELRMDILMDRMEAYQIISEVFYEYIPDKEKIKALAQAAERIKYEIKDLK